MRCDRYNEVLMDENARRRITNGLILSNNAKKGTEMTEMTEFEDKMKTATQHGIKLTPASKGGWIVRIPERLNEDSLGAFSTLEEALGFIQTEFAAPEPDVEDLNRPATMQDLRDQVKKVGGAKETRTDVARAV